MAMVLVMYWVPKHEILAKYSLKEPTLIKISSGMSLVPISSMMSFRSVKYSDLFGYHDCQNDSRTGSERTYRPSTFLLKL